MNHIKKSFLIIIIFVFIFFILYEYLYEDESFILLIFLLIPDLVGFINKKIKNL